MQAALECNTLNWRRYRDFWSGRALVCGLVPAATCFHGYAISNSPVISYTTSGDTEVSLTGQDDWGRPWEKTELECSLEGVAATSQDSILAENPEATAPANDTNQQDTSRWIQVGDEGEGDGVGESSNDDPFNGWPDSFKPVTPSNSRVAGLALIAKSRSCLVCHQRGGLVWGGIHTWEQLSPAQQQTIGLWCHPPSARYEAAAIFVGAGTIALGTLAAGEILAVPAALYVFGTQSANSVTSGGFGLAVLEGTLDPSYPGNIATGPISVTDDAIRQAMRGAPLSSQQALGVSRPMIERFIRRLEAGEIPPPIQVDGNIIVEGNHRYIAGRMFGKEPPIIPWIGGKPDRVLSWEDLPIDPLDWDN